MTAPPVRRSKTFQIAGMGQSKSPGNVLHPLEMDRLTSPVVELSANAKSETLLSSWLVSWAIMSSVSTSSPPTFAAATGTVFSFAAARWQLVIAQLATEMILHTDSLPILLDSLGGRQPCDRADEEQRPAQYSHGIVKSESRSKIDKINEGLVEGEE